MIEFKGGVYDYRTGSYGTLTIAGRSGGCEVSVRWQPSEPDKAVRLMNIEFIVDKDVAAELHRLLGYYLDHELPQ